MNRVMPYVTAIRTNRLAKRDLPAVGAAVAFVAALCLLAVASSVAAADASQVTMQDYNILVRLDQGALYFHQTWVAKNGGQTKVAPLVVNLQTGYTDLSVARGPAADKLKPTAHGFEDTEGVEAGAEKEYVISFRVPYTSGSASLSFTAPYQTSGVVVLLDQKLELVGTGFTKGQVVSMGPNNYVEYDTAPTKANQAVAVQVKPIPGGVTPSTGSGTPAAGSAGAGQVAGAGSAGALAKPTSDQTATAFLIVLALLLFGAIGFFVAARNRGSQRQISNHASGSGGRPSPATDQDRPAARQEPRIAADGGGTTLALDTPEKRELVELMVDLDRRYEAGTIGETEYHQERAKVKSRLTALILASQANTDASTGSAGHRD